MLAFAGNVEGHLDIFTLRSDGTGLARLTNSPSQEAYPAWSPDGHYIAFASGRDASREIHVMNSNGNGQRKLTNFRRWSYEPSWSPDSRRIAFTAPLGAKPKVFVMKADGTEQRVLTPYDPERNETNPSWSPDGRHVVFMGFGTQPPGIFLIRSDGTQERPIGSGQEQYFLPARPWSPNGRYLMYQTQSGGVLVADLVLMEKDVVQATYSILAPNEGQMPAWAPDGWRIAYVGNCGIWSVNRAGSDRRKVVDIPTPCRVSDLSWSPDGRFIAYIATGEGAPPHKLLFYTVELRTNKTRRIFEAEEVKGPYDPPRLSWRPN